VGRDELGADAASLRPGQGGGWAVVVTGTAGIGMSSLLAVVAYVAADGMTVLRARRPARARWAQASACVRPALSRPARAAGSSVRPRMSSF
jgi:hypothetical protein